jgi:hypothetical protein
MRNLDYLTLWDKGQALEAEYAPLAKRNMINGGKNVPLSGKRIKKPINVIQKIANDLDISQSAWSRLKKVMKSNKNEIIDSLIRHEISLSRAERILIDKKRGIDRASWLTEDDIETIFDIKLCGEGNRTNRQVRCIGGRIDILSQDTIYEIKRHLTLDKMHEGLGQLIIYSHSYPEHKLVLVGQESSITRTIAQAVQRWGISVCLYSFPRTFVEI